MIIPGTSWLDTDGQVIQAHGGGMLEFDGRYYWYGENKDGPTYPNATGRSFRVDVIGMSCYVSDDLLAWQNTGVVLPARPDDPDHDLHPSQFLERPKVLHCPATGQFVMWMHIESPRRDKAAVGVAVAEQPTGPFTYLRSFRPHDCDSRDMTVFQDRDGSAWLISASEKNHTLHVTRLSEDYLGLDGDYERVLVDRHREAPAVFRHGERLYMITSGCTGWWPNRSEIAAADNMKGPWTILGDPFVADAEGNSFRSQSTCVIPMPDAGDGCFIYMGDRWEPEDLGSSTYVWLPFEVCGGRVTITWRDRWSPEWFKVHTTSDPEPSQ